MTHNLGGGDQQPRPVTDPDVVSLFNELAPVYDFMMTSLGQVIGYDVGEAVEQSGVRPERALDAGAGTGSTADVLLAKVGASLRELVVVDSSPIMLEELRNKVPDPRVTVVEDDILGYLQSVPPGSFGLVACINTLYFLDHEKQRKALGLMAGVLAASGLLLITFEPTIPGTRQEGPASTTEVSGRQITNYRMPTSEVLGLLGTQGMDVVSHRQYDPRTKLDQSQQNQIVFVVATKTGQPA